MTRPRYLFFRGCNVPYGEARVHILTTAFKYSATVFEGIRAYWSDLHNDLFLFRLDKHLDRLAASAKIARITLPMSQRQISDALITLICRNELREDLHVRVLLYVAADDGPLDSTEPVELAIAAVPMGRYPEMHKGKRALDVGISHWHRLSDDSMSPRVKATANYMNSRLALLQVRDSGYDDAILIDASGKVTEGPGYNLFVVRRGEVLTPPVTQGILEGVTRETLCNLFNEVHSITVTERTIDKTELFVADEAFFCGSGKEIKPIRSVDGLVLGDGQPGPITTAIRDTYFAATRGERPDNLDWLTPVYARRLPLAPSDGSGGRSA